MTATTPIGQIRIMKRALQRIGERHSWEGMVARLALMDATGVHPWKTECISEQKFQEHIEFERNHTKPKDD